MVDQFLIKYKSKTKITSNYYYLNFWSLGCRPCLDELPIVKMLPSKFNKNINCAIVSLHSDMAVNNFIENNKISMDNYVYINNALEFTNWVYESLTLEKYFFPLHLILDSKGKILAYQKGTIPDLNSASNIIKFVNEL